MQAVFHEIVLQFALSGLVAALVAIPVCAAFRRLRTQCRALNALNWTLAAPFLLVALTVGGTKTNGVNNLPQQQLMMPRPTLQTLNALPPAGGAVNLADPVQASRAAAFAADWNVCGAWKDSFWLPFADGWVFPWGTNHLSGVEVVSHGRLWPTPFDTNAVASAGAPFEIVPGLTSFAYELTPSNSYRFSWINAAISRDTNDLVSAVLELFRNGDRSVTTNGVTAYLPRTLPFARDGFGQDAEWVAANFTNATEIAAAGGYPQWVDAQVGTGLTNGLYKLTVTVPDDPPETTQITVGDLSVAVTNAGEYVFLLEKGPAYALRFFPFSTNIAVSAVDDIPALRSPPRLRSAAAWGDGIWTAENGEFVCNYFSESESGECWWLPLLVGSPDIAHIAPDSSDATFTAVVLDCAHPEDATFEWKVCEGLVAATPYAQSTVVTAEEFPSWRRVWMAVEARFGPFDWLTSTLDFTIGTNAVPQAGVALTIPRVMFVNDDDDDDDGTNDYEVVRFDSPEDDVVRGTVKFNSDDFTNGIIRVAIEGFSGDVYTNKDEFALPPETFDVPIEYDSYRTIDLYFNPYFQSAYQKGSVTAVWIPENGDPQTSSVPFTVVKPIAEPICSETAEHAVFGTNHVYTINPCGVAVDDDAYFRVQVTPNSLPDAEIVWTNRDGHVAFVDGNTGRNVHVRGVSAGDAQLEVLIGGRERHAPTFPLKVVEPQTFKITAWIVSDAEHNGARQVEDVENMIAPLNDIYRQVGVSFYLDTVTVTNIPGAYNLPYDSSTNDLWNVDRLVDIGHDTGGIECYFVNSLERSNNKPGPLACNNPRGIVLSAEASCITFAHEIGHAFGLSDIYASNREKDADIPAASEQHIYREFISESCCMDDWNGGCHGRGVCGTRYYPPATTLDAVLHRLLMYGAGGGEDDGRDLTIGAVRGVWYKSIGGEKIWYLGPAPVGFFENEDRLAVPIHQ